MLDLKNNNKIRVCYRVMTVAGSYKIMKYDIIDLYDYIDYMIILIYMIILLNNMIIYF